MARQTIPAGHGDSRPSYRIHRRFRIAELAVRRFDPSDFCIGAFVFGTPDRFGAFPPIRTFFHVLLPLTIVRFMSAKPFRCRPNYRPAIRRSARPPGCSMAGGDTPEGRSGTVRVLSPVRPAGRCFCSEWGEGCGTGSPMPRAGVRAGRSAGASRCGVFLVGSSPKRFRGSGKIAYFACINPRTK